MVFYSHIEPHKQSYGIFLNSIATNFERTRTFLHWSQGKSIIDEEVLIIMRRMSL